MGKWTSSYILDILENHDMELHALNRQLETLGGMLEADLEEIRHRVYPGAIRYDQERVQTSPDPDGSLVAVVQACDERREQHKRDVQSILARLRDIRAVYSAIQRLDAVGKVTLLSLYYPRKSTDKVAEGMGIDCKTVWRHRDKAVESLKDYFSEMSVDAR